MNNRIKNIIIFLVVVSFTAVFFTSNALANGLSITVKKECDIEYMGENCVVEMTVNNTTGNDLDGEAIFHADFNGSNFDGIGITPYFLIKDSGWLGFGTWTNGDTSTGQEAFIIEAGESSAELKINTHPALYPGNYKFSLTLEGTTQEEEEEEEEEEEYTTTTDVGGGGGGTTGTEEETEEETTEEEETEEVTTEESTPPGEVAGEQTEREKQTGVGGDEPQEPYISGEVKGDQDIAGELIKEDDLQLSDKEMDKNAAAVVIKTLFGVSKYTIPLLSLLIILIILLLILTKKRKRE